MNEGVNKSETEYGQLHTLSFPVDPDFIGDDYTCTLTSLNKSASSTFQVRVNGPLKAGHFVGIAFGVATILGAILFLSYTIYMSVVLLYIDAI